jgi:hypothetical protein
MAMVVVMMVMADAGPGAPAPTRRLRCGKSRTGEQERQNTRQGAGAE